MPDFRELAALLGGRSRVDAVCPICSPHRKPEHRRLKVLRIWSLDADAITYFCIHCEEKGTVFADDRRRPLDDWEKRQRAKAYAEKQRAIDQEREAWKAEQINGLWRRTSDSLNTRAEAYLLGRGLRLPTDPEVRCRTLRYGENVPFGKGEFSPWALICAFTPVLTKVDVDPFNDPPVTAIHRIRGRGHDNKRMWGKVDGSAIMISPWWHVHETLHVCEGVETALALYGEGRDVEDCQRPVWAMGCAGAIERLPVIERVRTLHIWADHDRSGTGLQAARDCAKKWTKAGKDVEIHQPGKEGTDYADPS